MVGSAYALQLLIDHYDKSKLRQWAHLLAYSVTYKIKIQVGAAHHSIGVVGEKLFQELMSVAQ
jgi:hypothetical protein